VKEFFIDNFVLGILSVEEMAVVVSFIAIRSHKLKKTSRTRALSEGTPTKDKRV
jgi:hypothetical protein